MSRRCLNRLFIGALALIILPVAAADAAAKAKQKKAKVLPARSLAVKGTVIGTPYQVGSRVFVPVLLQAASVKKAKLSAAQGLLSVPRTMLAVPPKGAKVPVTHLRTGDGFTANTRVTNAIRKAPAPQLGVTKLYLPRRGLKLSAAELEDRLKSLDSGLRTLAVFTVGQITDLRAQIAAHTGRLTTLTQQIAALQAQMAALPPDQTAAIAALAAQIATLQGQAAAVGSTVTGLQGTVTTLVSQVQFLCSEDIVTGNPVLGILSLANMGACPS